MPSNSHKEDKVVLSCHRFSIWAILASSVLCVAGTTDRWLE
eukprot:CAMPEP_0204023840 /NCGR_PEP_ID=MMETSP0360-20130528/36863_1 /ASSEMBLY_ACC=CAM_ASM_000342 /TAXON_ID=268821 /ORGANISM="Scrippsiella Hangoei, Strain SHTV-5" /LENGTH=40 /DNA_ID= /DNA_START= /DNA_END= /DNA_ORIENTATION=